MDIILLVISWIRSGTRCYMQEAEREREEGGCGRNQEYRNLTTYSVQSPHKPGLIILKRRINLRLVNTYIQSNRIWKWDMAIKISKQLLNWKCILPPIVINYKYIFNSCLPCTHIFYNMTLQLFSFNKWSLLFYPLYLDWFCHLLWLMQCTFPCSLPDLCQCDMCSPRWICSSVRNNGGKLSYSGNSRNRATS